MRIRESETIRVVLPALLFGVVLVITTHQLALRMELDRSHQLFQDVADDEARLVERRLAVALESLYALRAFFHGSEEVTDAEFRSFARDLCRRHGILQALEWVPLVRSADRERHEEQTRRAGFPDYTIRELGPDGSLVPAAEREFYRPIRYLEPSPGQSSALGFDLASEPTRRNALQRASREQRAVISDPLDLVQGNRGAVSFVVALPIERFASDQPPPYAQGSFLLAVLSPRLEALISSPADLDPFFDISLVDPDLAGNGLLLSWKSPDAEARVWPGIQQDRKIEIGGRRWHLLSRPRRDFIQHSQTALPLTVAGGTLALWVTVVVAGLTLSRLGRERSRHRHSQILDSVLATVDEGIVVADASGRLLLVNEAARRYVGRVDDQLSVSQWPLRLGAYQEDEETLFDSVDLPLVRAMRGETIPATEIFLRNPATPEGAWLTVTGKPLVDPSGERRGGVVVIRDHTSEKRAQANLDRLGRAVEATADAVFITDRDGTIEYVNEAFVQMTGYSRREALGQTPRILRPGRHDEHFYEELWNSLLSGDVHRSSVVNRRKSGALFDAELTITPMRNSSGAVKDFVAVMKDMTESLRRQEQEVELRLAAQVQKRLYPQRFPQVGGWEFAGRVVPAEATCGDYYDFVHMGNGHIGMAIGDVCGHGLGPALVMSEVRALLRQGATATSDPAELLRRANETLSQDLEDHSFVTLLLAAVDTSARRLRWVNAGHPSGFVLKRSGELRMELASQTLPLGILPEFSLCAADETDLETGDLILLVTDGITEAGPDESRLFGSERALDTIRRLRSRPVDEIVEGLIETVRDFNAAPQTDDITLIVVRVG